MKRRIILKKVLFLATTRSHIGQFHRPYIKFLGEIGYEIHVAAKDNSMDINIAIDEPHKFINIPFERSPFNTSNFKSYRMVKKLINDNKYDLIHCNTPVGGVVARVASKLAKSRARVIYTAHGFHFFKGATIKNWILYLPIEKILSKYADCLITINNEDYNNAKKYRFKTKMIKLVNGVGFNHDKFKPQTSDSKFEMRDKYGYSKDSFIVLYAAELTRRKHQDLVIKAIRHLKDTIPEIKLLIGGVGDREDEYRELVKELDLDKYIEFLGYRNDINNLMHLSDLVVSSSRQEGLPVNIMEAMAVGLPLVVTDCRGNRDLIKNGVNGYVVNIDDDTEFGNAIYRIYESKEIRQKFSRNNLKAVQKYSINEVLKEMKKIYLILLNHN